MTSSESELGTIKGSVLYLEKQATLHSQKLNHIDNIQLRDINNINNDINNIQVIIINFIIIYIYI